MESLVEVAESLRGAHLRRCSHEEVQQKLCVLLADFEALCIERSEHQIWYRARVCDTPEGYANLHQCIYPPADQVGYGGANLPKAPALYSAWNVNTALDEISAESGQIVQVIYLAVKPGMGVACNVVGDYSHILNSGRSFVNSDKLVGVVKKDLSADYTT